MKKQKQSQSNDRWVILELNIKPERDKFPIVFGPFVLRDEAVDFCNGRICMLAGEWVAEDGLLTDYIQWKLEKCNTI